MVTYTTQVLSLYVAPHVDGLNNVVKRVTWSYTANEDIHTTSIYKETFFEQTDSQSFIAYNDLSEQTIIGWLQQVEDFTELTNNINTKLEEIKSSNTVVEKKLPWIITKEYDLMDKYVLVHNGEVIYGPVHWHSDLINPYLENLGVTQLLPETIVARQRFLLPINEPLIITENIKIYKVNLLNEQPEDSIFTNNGNIIWDFSTGIAEGTYVVVDKNINEIKDTIYRSVFELKLYKEEQGLNITVNNTPVNVHTGIVTFLSLYEKSIMLQDGESCWIRFNHNVWLELNKNEIINIMNEVGQYRKATDVWEHNLSLQITNATTVNELQQIYSSIMS